MKFKIYTLLLLLLVCFSTNLLADPWDCMDHQQAEKLVEYLKANPYIVDYCDPCDDLSAKYDNERIPAYLVLVKNPRITTCNWDESQFSVQVDFETLAWGYTDQNRNILNPKGASELTGDLGPSPVFRDDPRYCPTLNYHWTLVNGQPSRLCYSVNYENSMQNDGLAAFPSFHVVENKKQRKLYKKWLNSKP